MSLTSWATGLFTRKIQKTVGPMDLSGPFLPAETIGGIWLLQYQNRSRLDLQPINHFHVFRVANRWTHPHGIDRNLEPLPATVAGMQRAIQDAIRPGFPLDHVMAYMETDKGLLPISPPLKSPFDLADWLTENVSPYIEPEAEGYKRPALEDWLHAIRISLYTWAPEPLWSTPGVMDPEAAPQPDPPL
jgi:hypothetical protein